MKTLLLPGVLFVWLGVGSVCCPAQVTTATFYGIVTDSSGAAVPGAAVALVNEDTSATLTRTTDAAGEFTFDFLRVGGYTLRIEAPSFKNRHQTRRVLERYNITDQTDTLEAGKLSEEFLNQALSENSSQNSSQIEGGRMNADTKTARMIKAAISAGYSGLKLGAERGTCSLAPY